jgi:hypothetical protein
MYSFTYKIYQKFPLNAKLALNPFTFRMSAYSSKLWMLRILFNVQDGELSMREFTGL